MFKYYKVFVSKGMLLFLSLFTIAMIALPFAFTEGLGIYPLVGVMTAAVMTIIATLMTDFFCFGGIAVKNQKIMEYCRSSFKGTMVVKNGLVADVLLVIVKMFLISGSGILYVTLSADIAFSLYTVLFMLAVSATGTIIIFLSQLITRRFCKTITTHMIISYMVTSVSSLAYIPALMFFTDTQITAVSVIYTILALAITAALAIAVVITGVKGYESGFYDKQ